MSRYATGLGLGLLALLALFPGCSSNEAAPVAETADAAVLQITEGLADGRPQVLWHALPESYQQDVTDLIHEFGNKMDAELWNSSFEVVQKVTLVLSEKREFILDHPMLASKVEDREEAEEAWDALIGILEVVANSDLSNLDRVKKLDVERFLSKTGGELVDRFKQIEAFAPTDKVPGLGLADAKATLISSEGDNALVRIEVPGKPAEEQDFVRVEGKWIPAEMAAEWDQTMAEAREGLAGLSGEKMEQAKASTLMQLSMVDGALDQLLATKTAEEFQTAVGGLMGMAMGAMMSRAQNSWGAGVFDNSAPTFGAPQASTEPQPNFEPTLEPTPQTRQEQVKARTQVHRREGVAAYIGEEVRVTDRNGSNTDGFLIDVTDKMLIVEKRVVGGSIQIEMARNRVDKVEPI
jgi:hypothetical protein